MREICLVNRNDYDDDDDDDGYDDDADDGPLYSCDWWQTVNDTVAVSV